MHTAAINYLKTRSDIDQNKIIIFGRSLGGAVAVDCVSRSEISSRVAAVILENTFTSIPDMAKVLFSNVKFLAKLPSGVTRISTCQNTRCAEWLCQHYSSQARQTHWYLHV
ncbi:putative alpha/beta hydrolase domain-containing protein 13 [Penaeus vannamei]|uniref:Putative alpha/beta hydrolase domain-containing protein 13 n=1 Tax=Penaeus vannamei TaxID=6689 RepID=A0A3R7M6M7_PENVA|nr:putative alpha/beta hydrolase domain-containing protein 13 [Penaeus vannamei]